MTRHARNATIAKAFSQPGGGNTIAEYAVRRDNYISTSVHGSNSPWQVKYSALAVPPISSRVLDSATMV